MESQVKIPGYEIVKLIGKGSVGEVYECISNKQSTIFAVKIISF